MQEILLDGVRITLDDEGFLADPSVWTESIARFLASREGVAELASADLDILKFLRTYYRKHAFFPMLRAVCRNIGQPPTCVTDRFEDPVTAWKIAGLPNPGDEVTGFRSWEPLGF